LIQNHASTIIIIIIIINQDEQQITAGRACLWELIAAKLKQSITSFSTQITVLRVWNRYSFRPPELRQQPFPYIINFSIINRGIRRPNRLITHSTQHPGYDLARRLNERDRSKHRRHLPQRESH
jgi:hypothetical protein